MFDGRKRYDGNTRCGGMIGVTLLALAAAWSQVAAAERICANSGCRSDLQIAMSGEDRDLEIAPTPGGFTCSDVALRHAAVGKQAASRRELDAAAQAFMRALESCPSYEYYYLLGLVQRDQGTSEAYRAALRSFASARNAASQVEQRALAIARFGEVAQLLEEPDQGLLYYRQARNLLYPQPAPEWLEQKIIELESRPVTVERVRRLGEGNSASLELGEILPLEGPEDTDAPMRTASRFLDVRLHFAFNSVELSDADSEELLDILAEGLASEVFDGKKVWLVGHSDAQGDETYNWNLSERRAEAVYARLIEMRPELEDRLLWQGMGESAPAMLGDSELAYRLNRRLEVRVEQP